MRNKYIPVFLLLSTMIAGCATKSPGGVESGLAYMVNPFIGTDYTGNTYPGAQVPHGMVQLSPDNGLPGWDRIAGYFYPDSTIAGFSHTHLSGTGAGDLYDISFMPVMLPVREADAPLGIYSRFSHESEEAYAGYYKVTLDDYDIDVELTATERCGIQRYTFHRSGQAAVILNLAKAMNWDSVTSANVYVADSVTLAGHRHSAGWARDQRVYFRSRFSQAPDSVKISSDGVAWCYFTPREDERLCVFTAISGVDEDGAARNLLAEVPHNVFSRYLKDAVGRWNRELGTVKVQSADTTALTTFYTALYHAMITPTIYGDVDGRYWGPDKKIHKSTGWTNYSTFSLWDTYRAQHPLLTILSPKRDADMVKSLLAFYDQWGRLPVWIMWGGETDMMIGYHSVPVIVDAVLKGVADIDSRQALSACVATSNIDDYRGIGYYKSLGYVPYNIKDPYCNDDWALSRTLEYAYDDYCIAMLARHLGEKDIEAEYLRRSRNFRNVFNPASGFMQPKDDKGMWQPDFSPDEYTPHICESNGWHYYWSVQHDIDGLVELTGGVDKFAARLDSMFSYTPASNVGLPIFSTGMIGQYAHGNEPSHHVIFLYNHVRQPWKAQKLTRKVLSELYNDSPAGLCGNDDCGQTSAWYVFAAMGLYPVNPVSGEYELVTPMFDSVEITVADGRTFTIRALGAEHGIKPYIKSVTVDGEPYRNSYITHDMIVSGSTVELELTDEEGHVWY